MDILRKSAAAILIVCMLIINSPTRATDHEREVEETSKPSISDDHRNSFISSYWGKLKTLAKQSNGRFFPPNIDFRGAGGEDAEAVSNGGGSSAAEKVKEAVAKSLEKSKDTMGGFAISAATLAKEKLKKSFSSQQQVQQPADGGGSSAGEKMEGGGTFCKSRGSYSTTCSDGSSVKIKVLLYSNSRPTFSVSDGKLQIDGGDLPRLIHLRKDISYEDFESQNNSYRTFSYYLPGQGLIALSTEEDMKNMMEEFDGLNCIQGPQIFKIFGKW